MDFAEIFKFAADYGLFPVLFVFAFWYIISESKARENAQRELYIKMSEDLEVISDAMTAIEEASKRTDANVSNNAQVSTNISQEVIQIKYMINAMETIIKSKL